MKIAVRFVTELALIAALALCAVASAGCMFDGYSTRDRVTFAARQYNEDVRWGRFLQAAAHVPKDRKDRFLEQHKNLDDDLEIADYDMTGIEIDKSDKKHEKITAHVDYTWTLKSTGLVRKTSTTQEWEEKDGTWYMAKEERVKGTPLALFDEPAHK